MISQMSTYMACLSDEALVREYQQAKQDSALAAATERDSEWHNACQMALMSMAFEIERRNLK